MSRRVGFRDTVYFDELTEFAEREGWQGETPGGEPVRGSEPHEFERWHFRWRTPDGAYVDFVDDETTEYQLLDIDESVTDTVEPAVREIFDVMDATEAAQAYLADPDTNHREQLLRLIAGVVSAQEEKVVAEAITDGLRDNASMVRLAAIIAAGASHWPQFGERLTAIAAHDPDPNFQLLARSSLKKLES
jgi:hypothetical protein